MHIQVRTEWNKKAYSTELRREDQKATENKSEKLNDLGFLMNSCVIFALILLFFSRIRLFGNVSEGAIFLHISMVSQDLDVLFNIRGSPEKQKLIGFHYEKPFSSPLSLPVSFFRHSAPKNANKCGPHKMKFLTIKHERPMTI